MRSLLFLVLLLYLGIASHGQSAETCLKQASDYLHSGKTDPAQRLYRRIAFFTPDGQKTKLWLQAAQIADSAKHFLFAEQFCNSALSHKTNSPDSLLNRIFLLKAKTLLIQHKNHAAFSILSQVGQNLSASEQMSFDFYKGTAFLEMGEIENAKTQFQNQIRDTAALDIIFKTYLRRHNPKPELAAKLSRILPGSGQLYAGYPNEAANNFLLNAGLFIVLYDLSCNYSWYTGLLSVFPWYNRYARASPVKAEKLALQKQAENRQKLLSEIIRLFPSE